MWQRVCLPAAGSISEQDAWLMAALEYLCDVHNQMTSEAMADARKKRNRGTSGD